MMKIKNKEIIAIIPARGNSKEIPKKNVIDFCGKPLIVWSIEQALGSRYIQEVYVSSDNREILEISKKSGAKAIKRPKKLAMDTSPSEEALLHAVNYIQKSTRKMIDIVVFLQASSPLRTSKDIDTAIELLISKRADCLFSAAILEDFCIWQRKKNNYRSMSFDYKNRGRRQDRPKLYLENGSIYIFKPKILEKYNNRFGGKMAISIMDYWKSYEIDKPEDVEVCEYFMQKLLNK